MSRASKYLRKKLAEGGTLPEEENILQPVAPQQAMLQPQAAAAPAQAQQAMPQPRMAAAAPTQAQQATAQPQMAASGPQRPAYDGTSAPNPEKYVGGALSLFYKEDLAAWNSSQKDNSGSNMTPPVESVVEQPSTTSTVPTGPEAAIWGCAVAC